MTDGMVSWLNGALDEVERAAKAQRARESYGHITFSSRATCSPLSPKAALARVEADRGIVEWCTEVIGDRDLGRYGEFGSLRDDPMALAVTLAVETLRCLAHGHRFDAEGYRAEWAPEGVTVDA